MANNDEQQQQLDITQGLEFTSLHSDDGLDALTASGAEEPRGPRPKISEPGRTYECEIWCRDASRQVAGCLGFTALILTYAALGAFLFMAIGEWFFSNLIEQVDAKYLCASKGRRGKVIL